MRVKRNAVVSLAVFLLSAFIYYVITMRRSFVRIDDRIPYVWNRDFNSTLKSYVRTAPSRHVLVLTGPYQCGKSRALEIIGQELAAAGRVPISIDFAPAQSLADAVGLIKLGVTKGLADAYPRLSSLKLRKAAALFGDRAEDSLSTVQMGLGKILDRVCERPFDISKFFDCLEALAPSLEPVVFAHSVDHLAEVAPELFSAARARLSRRPLYEDVVPVVAEVRDSSFHAKAPIDDDSVSEFELGELHDPIFTLVVQTRALSSVELRKIVDRFGAHGGTIERVFEDMKAGIGIDKAIEKEANILKGYLKEVVTGEQLNAIEEMCHHKADGQDKATLAALAPLLKTGHVYLAKNLTLSFAHRGVEDALCRNIM